MRAIGSLIAFVICGFILLLLWDTRMPAYPMLPAPTLSTPSLAATPVIPSMLTLLVDRSDDSMVDNSGNDLACLDDLPDDCTLRRALSIATVHEGTCQVKFAEHLAIQVLQPLVVTGSDIIVSGDGLEVHVFADTDVREIFRIEGQRITVSGLRVYGASISNIHIADGAEAIQLADNLIGDDYWDQACHLPHRTRFGVTVGSDGYVSIPTWLYGNVVQCHVEDGLWIRASSVIIGNNDDPVETIAEQNRIHNNGRYGVNLGRSAGNMVCNNVIFDNGLFETGSDEAFSIYVLNFNNDILHNDVNHGA